MNNYVLITLDSCRYDSILKAWDRLQLLPRLGPLQEAYSFATWTHPAHLNFLTGRLPWIISSTIGLRSGGREFYTGLPAWERRLGQPLSRVIDEDLNILKVVQELGYTPFAIVSAKPIGPGTLFARQFEHFHYVGRDGLTLQRITDTFRDAILPMTRTRPCFGILNASETHYPYFDGSKGHQFETRRVPSWHREVSRGLEGIGPSERIHFTKEELEELKLRQERAVIIADKALSSLFDILPRPCFVTVTADHGDCLGEDGQFLHGEVFESTVLRVPFIEGVVE